MTTPIHGLCLNFTEIVRREVGETMPCFADKQECCKSTKCGFVGAILRPFGGRHQMFIGQRVTYPVKFRPNRFSLAEVIPEKVIWYDHSYAIRIKKF